MGLSRYCEQWEDLKKVADPIYSFILTPFIPVATPHRKAPDSFCLVLFFFGARTVPRVETV